MQSVTDLHNSELCVNISQNVSVGPKLSSVLHFALWNYILTLGSIMLEGLFNVQV